MSLQTKQEPKQLFNEKIVNDNGYDSLSSSSGEQQSDIRIKEIDNANIDIVRDKLQCLKIDTLLEQESEDSESLYFQEVTEQTPKVYYTNGLLDQLNQQMPISRNHQEASVIQRPRNRCFTY